MAGLFAFLSILVFIGEITLYIKNYNITLFGYKIEKSSFFLI